MKLKHTNHKNLELWENSKTVICFCLYKPTIVYIVFNCFIVFYYLYHLLSTFYHYCCYNDPASPWQSIKFQGKIWIHTLTMSSNWDYFIKTNQARQTFIRVSKQCTGSSMCIQLEVNAFLKWRANQCISVVQWKPCNSRMLNSSKKGKTVFLFIQHPDIF